MNRWNKEELEFIKKQYSSLNNDLISKRLNRTKQAIRNKSYRLKIKKNRRRDFCKTCEKELIQGVKRYGKIYLYPSYSNKSGLCRSCSSKEVYKKRGRFTHHNGKFFTQKEIRTIKELFPIKTNEEIGAILSRTTSSITHKANRLGLHKPKDFFLTHPELKKKLFTSKNNPIYNPLIKKKMRDSIKKGWETNKYSINGCAKKSMAGLTKKENHPNWKGGISFEPYDSNFDEIFREEIRERDSRICFICEKTEQEEQKQIQQKLCIHHIDYNKKNSGKRNCISLCNSCHCKTNYKRIKWILFFRKKMNKDYDYNYNPQLKLIRATY